MAAVDKRVTVGGINLAGSELIAANGGGRKRLQSDLPEIYVAAVSLPIEIATHCGRDGGGTAPCGFPAGSGT